MKKEFIVILMCIKVDANPEPHKTGTTGPHGCETMATRTGQPRYGNETDG